MTIEIASVLCGGPGLKAVSTNFKTLEMRPFGDVPVDVPAYYEPPGFGNVRVSFWNNQKNESTPCQVYQQILEASRADVIVYAHDDLDITEEGWLARIERIFAEHPDCVAVGLGGATGLGTRDLGRKPWNIWQMARSGYASNQTDAEVHGERFTGDRRVVVLEQFCQAIRTDWLRSIGGWPVAHLSHHLLDAFIACEAAKARKEIWQVGAACHHAGGASSTKNVYAAAKWLQGGSMQGDHEIPHRWIFQQYRDVLPLEAR